jgi:hypothetical protein
VYALNSSEKGVNAWHSFGSGGLRVAANNDTTPLQATDTNTRATIK